MGPQDTARKLYGHIDNLELYPGLQAEVSSVVSYPAGRTRDMWLIC